MSCRGLRIKATLEPTARGMETRPWKSKGCRGSWAARGRDEEDGEQTGGTGNLTRP